MTKSEAAKYEREKQERLAALRQKAWDLAKQAKLMAAKDPVDYIWGYIAGSQFSPFEAGYIGEHACDYLEKI